MTTRLRTFMKIQANPNLAILDFLENTEKMNDRMARRIVAETLQAVIDDFNKTLIELAKQLEMSIPEMSKQIAANGIQNFIQQNSWRFKGEKGEQGLRGTNGTDGKDGKDGINGINGINGKAGLNGKDGKDFSPEKIKEIFERFDELNKKITNLKQNVKGSKGGGGMGNAVHKVFNLTALTTTLTLDYPIAGNGTAIFAARYQSAVQDLDVHYSVGGGDKVITLLFVPEDATTFSISYIRG